MRLCRDCMAPLAWSRIWKDPLRQLRIPAFLSDCGCALAYCTPSLWSHLAHIALRRRDRGLSGKLARRPPSTCWWRPRVLRAAIPPRSSVASAAIRCPWPTFSSRCRLGARWERFNGRVVPATPIVISSSSQQRRWRKARCGHGSHRATGSDACWCLSTGSTRGSPMQHCNSLRSRMTPIPGRRQILFSWPSRGGLLNYSYDKESANFSRGDLANVLRTAADSPAVAEVTVLAHSMGAWLAMEALRQVALEDDGDLPRSTTSS